MKLPRIFAAVATCSALAASAPVYAVAAPAFAAKRHHRSTETVGSYSHSGDAQFCSTHPCIEHFPRGKGYIIKCRDGMYSHSGGRKTSCSRHGGPA